MPLHRIANRCLTIVAILGLGLAASPGRGQPVTQPGDRVLPLTLPEQNDPEIHAVQARLYRSAQTQAHYLLTLVHPWSTDPTLKLMTASKSTEHFIRPNATAIQGFAFLYRFGPYDAERLGVSRTELLNQIIIPMMRYLTTTHVTGTRPTADGKPWGDQWQSALWAQFLGRSAWWLWADLPADLRADIRQVIAHEADRFVNAEPPHQLKLNTRAEENAWNSKVVDVAVLIMPDDPRRAAWERTFQRWVLSSFLRPTDEHNAALVDGRSVAEQFTGANIYDDYTLENHARVHPDYMAAITTTLGCELDYRLSGRKPPEALYHNVQGIYDNLKWFFLPDGGCVYPNGEDWELFSNISKWIDQNVQMAVFMHDPDAWSLLKACLPTLEKMHARDPNGPLYIREEYFYPGAPQIVLERRAREWLMLQTARNIVNQPRPLLGVKRLDAGRLIVHRMPNAIHTVSWGAVIMAQCVPWQLDRVVSPETRDGVGMVRLKGEKDASKVSLVAADVTDSAGGFVAALTLDHGDAVRAKLEFRSNADGTFVMRETLTALRDASTTRIATGMIGVLNNPKWVYEAHHRVIRFDSETADVPALSGKTLTGEKVREIDIDGALQIRGAAPLSAAYLGAKQIERGRASDRLYLNVIDGERAWKRDEVISTYAATITPRPKGNVD